MRSSNNRSDNNRNRSAKDKLKLADKVLSNIVPIAEYVVDDVRNSMGSWGFENLIGIPIRDYCLVGMAEWQLRKSMYLNAVERQITLDMVGDTASGISNKVSDEFYKHAYTYSQDNNYVLNYQRSAKNGGTRVGIDDNFINDYTDGNQLYKRSINLYPDENNSGNVNFLDDSKWSINEQNRNKYSILRKTKQLFNERKINTIISRFHTDSDKKDLYDGTDAKSVYGLSHGRNLLTYDAERNGKSYMTNGYDNPYCRVWTHHHQYIESRSRLIRPFTQEDKDGNPIAQSQPDFQKWTNFEDMRDGTVKPNKYYNNETKKFEFQFNDKPYNEWSWKNKGSEGWNKSVLDKETGLVNITPKFLGGAEKNIHTKDCMFSIENLAWQGYDPYSFEKALSWEQRGPFGGRIMWFPPYGLRFNEESSVNWNEHSFIGRGENVYTYTNTVRSGTLEFMMVVDHPSIIDYATWYGESQPDKLPKDTDVLRFFAGCDGGGAGASVGNPFDRNSTGESGSGGVGGLRSYARPTPLTDEYLSSNNEAIPVEENVKPEPETPKQEEVPPSDEEIEINFYVFFPNNYSGAFDNVQGSVVDPIAYLLCGDGAQWKCNDEDVTKSQSLPIYFKNISNDSVNTIGNGYEMNGSGSEDSQDNTNNYIIGTSPNWNGYKSSVYVPVESKKWYYRIDGEYKIGKGPDTKIVDGDEYKNTFDQTLVTSNDYKDTYSYKLNGIIDNVKTCFPEESENSNLYSLAEVAYVLLGQGDTENADQLLIKSKSGLTVEERIKKLIDMFDTSEDSIYKVTSISCVGFSNSHANNANPTLNDMRNKFLAQERARTVIKWFKENYNGGNNSITDEGTSISGYAVDSSDLKNVSGLSAKKYRSAKATIKIKKSGVITPQDIKPQEEEDSQTDKNRFKRFTGFDECEIDLKTNTQLYINANETDPSKKDRRWYYDESTHEMKLFDERNTKRSNYNWNSTKILNDNYKQTEEKNSLRYDQEYHFFKKLNEKHPDVFDSLVKKLQYFDPAFHSMTPEGFMGRLNFLHQCTRQGNTITATDGHGHSANNLAFGRPPFCILRLGDFYYQKIVIRNISISYDPLVLDLNNEGIGVVPLIANVTISFNFIGGGDLSGPVRRLQNAMSFNYYANGRLYDNRSDRVEHEDTNWETMGAMGNDKVDFNASYFHNVQMAK